MSKEITLQKLKELNIIYREPVKLKHVEISNFYADVKKSEGYTEILKMLADDLWEIMDKRINCIVSQGYGGLPLSTAIAIRHGIPYQTFVRDRPKDHGLGGLLDGYVPTQNDVIGIVDDVSTTGGSLRENTQAIKPTGAKVVGAYTVVKRGTFDLEVPYKWLFFPEDFL